MSLILCNLTPRTFAASSEKKSPLKNTSFELFPNANEENMNGINGTALGCPAPSKNKWIECG